EPRIAAFDGVLALNSPIGGPTTAVLELPSGGAARQPIPVWKGVIMIAGWSLSWLPMFAQGFVPMTYKIMGSDEKAWFLALHLPEPYQWPVIAGMILLGATMFTAGAVISAQLKRQRGG